jgi:hypothetical protein
MEEETDAVEKDANGSESISGGGEGPGVNLFA